MIKKLLYLLLFTTVITACKKTEPSQPEPAATVEISSITPKEPKPGDVVTITGKGFGTVVSDVKVAIGATNITIISVNDTEIRFALPTGISEGALSLMIKNVKAAMNDPQGATIKPKPATQPVPTFTALSPVHGKAGDVITLTGTNFSTIVLENVVKFTGALSGAPVTAVIKSATATSITVEVPTGAVTGLMSIEVKGVYAELATGFNGIFTVDSSGIGSGTGTLTLLDNIKANAYAMATDDDANIYITSTNSAKNLLKLSPTGEILKTYATTEFRTTGHVAAVCNDKNGTIWLIQGNSRNTAKIYKIVKGSNAVVYVRDINADLVGYNQYSSLSSPLLDMAVDSKGNVFYVDDQYDIYKIDLNGAQTMFIESDKLPVDQSKSVRIMDITIDKNDNLYAGGGNQAYNLSTLFKITPEKVVTQLFYSASNGYADGPAAQARFERIYNVEVNAEGTELYIGDVNYLRKLNLTTMQITTAAGNGKPMGLTTVNGQIKANGDGPALETPSAPAKLSFCDKLKVLYIKNLNDSILQVLK
jgi:hypothetical protein